MASVATAADAPPDAARQLSAQAGAAYEGKRFAEAAELFVKAAEAGAGKASASYNAACSYALSGQPDKAFAQLQSAIDAGLEQSPEKDSDLASLHVDPRWPQLLARFDAAHPEARAMVALMDQFVPTATRYFAGRQAIADGVPTTDTHSAFNQYYTFTAQFVGEYDEASRIYGFLPKVDDPVAAGFSRAVDAVPEVLARAHGRKAVFLNELHGQSQTRAANFALLAGMRADGFDVLAMETLAATDPVPRDATHCSDSSLFDPQLSERGYPLGKSGYYSADPVYAETVREALRLGFRLISYDTYLTSNSRAVREQNQAENLACVFKADPKARLLVIAGMAHIGEGKDFIAPGGMMAYRFRELTGVDPLTIDTASQAGLDESTLVFATGAARRPVSYVLQNAAGEAYGTANYDLALFVPAPAHRNDGEPSWLELGGLRLRTVVAAAECQGRDPCLVEARRAGEVAEAVPSDRCIVSGAMPGCTLFLRPGHYEIATIDSAGAGLSHRALEVSGKSP